MFFADFDLSFAGPLRALGIARIVLLMSNTETARKNLTAAIAHWTNCIGKGTKAQRIMTERTIRERTARLEALS